MPLFIQFVVAALQQLKSKSDKRKGELGIQTAGGTATALASQATDALSKQQARAPKAIPTSPALTPNQQINTPPLSTGTPSLQAPTVSTTFSPPIKTPTSFPTSFK